MKKATMNTILSLIATIDTPEANEVRAELNAELNKGAELKARNAELYEAVKPIVVEELGDSTCTISPEILSDSTTLLSPRTPSSTYSLTPLALGSPLSQYGSPQQGTDPFFKCPQQC